MLGSRTNLLRRNGDAFRVIRGVVPPLEIHNHREDSMKKHLGIAAALVLLALPLAASAAPATQQQVNVTGWVEGSGPGTGPTSDVYGAASLVRTDNGISMTFSTSHIPAGEAVTIWWIILGPNGPVSAQFAAGHVVGGSGVASFAGHLAEGDTSGCFSPEFTAAVGCNGLTDARTQTVILLARFHGLAEPGRIPTQIHTPETAGITDLGQQLCSPLACQYQAAIFPGA